LLRREAVLLLQEIFDCCQDATLINFVSLKHVTKNGDSEAEDFELHLKAHILESVGNIIEVIAEKHQLLVKHSGEYMIIYSPQNPLVQIPDKLSNTAPIFA
jgi:hypothetical protein